MAAGRGRRCVAACVAALSFALAAGDVEAGRGSTIVLSGYETDAIVVSTSGSDTQTIRVDFGPDQPPLPEKFVLDVPKGYTLDLSAKPGTEIALASISIVGVDSPSIASAFGFLVAEDPGAFAANPSAQACAPGRHAAVWSMSTAIAGQKVDLTIFVDPGKEPDVAYVLAACPTELAATNTSSAASITLSGIDGLVSPTAPGDYRWRSLVTPRGRKGYELQALVPLPEAVTLDSRYDAKRKLATLSGTVIEGGVVVPHVPLALISSRNGSTLDFVDAKTDGSGRFVVKVHVTRTTDFTVDVAPSVGPCTAASTAPAGCLASTTVPPDDTFATAWVSVPGGAVRAIRRGDQRLAERAGLRDDDVPADFEATLTGGDDCLNQKGESRLTITGESTSPAFYKLTQDETPTIAETLGVTRVYATSTQAKHAFDHEARISTMRCEVKRLGAKPSRIKPRQFAASARLRAFRATFNLGAGSTASYDVVFLQRGRTVTTLTFVFVNAPDDLEGAVTSAVATRMR